METPVIKHDGVSVFCGVLQALPHGGVDKEGTPPGSGQHPRGYLGRDLMRGGCARDLMERRSGSRSDESGARPWAGRFKP